MTQGGEGIQHINRIPSIVGRLGASVKAGLHHQFCEFYFTAMVRMPGSSNDSAFKRERLRDDMKINQETGMEEFEAGGRRGRKKLKDLPNVKVLEGDLMK